MVETYNLNPDSTLMFPHFITRNSHRALRKVVKASDWKRTLSTSNVDEYHDIVIVGGGPAGLALAAALGTIPAIRDNLSIALVEGSDLGKIQSWAPSSDAYSNRVSSITNSSRQFLQDIGAWKNVDESRTCPIENMEVWDGLSDSRISFRSTDFPAPTSGSRREMARLTENLNLQRALLKRVKELSQTITVIDNQKVASIQPDGTEGSNWPVVSLMDGRSLRTRLLIGADGFNSPVKSFAQISSYGWAYPTNAVVATLNHQPRSDHTSTNYYMRPNTVAYQRFLPTGPIAFLPLSESVSSLVWSTTPKLAAILRSTHPDTLAKMVNAAFRLPDVSMNYLHSLILEHGRDITPELIDAEIRWREASHSIGPESALFSRDGASVGIPPLGSEDYPPLVTSIQPGTAASFPLRLSHADSYIGEGAGARTALVGDAAHTVHPLAGQGLNMGLADAQSLAETIGNTIANGGDIGTYMSLLPYHVARYTPNHAILSVTDKLHKLYSLTSPPAVWVRSVGLEVVNELGSLKAVLMGAAGAQGTGSGGIATTGWGAVARGVEFLNGSVQVGKVVVNGAGTIVAGLAQSVLKNLSAR